MLKALIRYLYTVFADRFESTKLVVFAPTIAICVKVAKAAHVHRSILNRLSLSELSVQVRLILLEERAEAEALLGARGGGGGGRVVASAMFEYAEFPLALNALTRYLYKVFAERFVLTKLVIFA